MGHYPDFTGEHERQQGYGGYGQQQPYGDPAGYPHPQAPGAPGNHPYAPYGYPYHPYGQVEHPQAQTVFILGILGIFTGITAFIAWYMGGQARKEIEAGAPYRWEGNLKSGYLLGKVFGIISIVGMAAAVAIWVFYIVFFIAMFGMLVP